MHAETGSGRLYETLERIDAENARDPNIEEADGAAAPKELVYGRRMSAWLERLRPGAPDTLRIAVRAQHLRRWELPRAAYPQDRTGYLMWRKRLYAHHADAAAALMRETGYGEDAVARVCFLLQKKQIKHDADTQTLEDCACLVFLEHHFAGYIGRWDDEKLVGILGKTWAKMSAQGRAAALALPMPPEGRRLLDAALAGHAPGAD